ncbi:MAG: hypothetical protein QOC62_5885 [Mycobacterium sp.]|jgi:hypothetical protein|nr:hypothetical protein [Mycobacterium sp.]
MSVAVRFERRGDHYEVSFPYDPAVVAVIKALPAYARRWNPESKVWRIDVGYARSLAGNLRELGHIVVGLEPPRANGKTIDGTDWARVMLRQVGHKRREPVFRALTRILHPDVATGDGRLQQQLNDAYAELKDNGR